MGINNQKDYLVYSTYFILYFNTNCRDVTNADEIKSLFAELKPDIVVSCLASRSGTKSDSYLIDYQATLNSLIAAKDAGI